MLSPARVMRSSISLLAALAVLALLPARAMASATAGTGNAPPRLLSERALIVWHPSLGTQHLLVTAELEAGEGPAALIVPTPLPPAIETLDEAPALDRLLSLHFENAKTAAPLAMAVAAPGQRVEGRLLQAADAGSLGGFLESKSMAAYPGLFAFARSYGARAFHYAALSLPEDVAGTRTLPWTAISFVTPRPFYPLATPEESIFGADAARHSKLEIFTLSPELLALPPGEANVESSVRLDRDDLATALGEPLLTALGIDATYSTLWLQRFEPARTPIDAADTFFARVPEPSQKGSHATAIAPARARNARRLLTLAIASAFGLAIAWAGSRERWPGLG